MNSFYNPKYVFFSTQTVIGCAAAQVGQQMQQEWSDSSAMECAYADVRTGWGSTGHWNFCVLGSNKACHQGVFTPDSRRYLGSHWMLPIGAEKKVTFKVKAKNDAHVAGPHGASVFFLEVILESPEFAMCFCCLLGHCWTSQVGFFSHLKSTRKDMYEIVIGGWGNGQSVIRQCNQCRNEVVKRTPNVNNLAGHLLWFHWVVVSNVFYFHPYLGKKSNLTNVFQTGWNHQLVSVLAQNPLSSIGMTPHTRLVRQAIVPQLLSS